MASSIEFQRGVAYTDGERILRFFSQASSINAPNELYIFRDINNNYIGLKPTEASKLRKL